MTKAVTALVDRGERNSYSAKAVAADGPLQLRLF